MNGQSTANTRPEKALLRIVRNPLPVLLAVLAVTLLFAWHLPSLSFKTSIYDLAVEDLPETANYEAFKKTFGSDEIIQVVVRSGESIFEPATFAKVGAIAEQLAAVRGVRQVVSLPHIKKDLDKMGNWSLPEFTTLVGPVELFRKNLISDDHKATAITLILSTDADPDRVIEKVGEIIAATPKTLSLYQIGMPLVSQALVHFTQRDFFRLPPITFCIIALLLLLLFRNIVCLIVPAVCIVTALLWTLGFMAWTGVPLSMLTMVVPIFLIAVGTAYCLYLCAEYMACASSCPSAADAVFSAFSNVTLPTILAVSTTVVGLGSIVVNRIAAIREFALFSCFGMLSLLVIVLTLFPALLAVLPLPRRKSAEGKHTPDVFDRIVAWLVDLNLNRQKLVYSLALAVAVFCGIGVFFIRVETNPVSYFKEDTPVSRHFHDVYRDLAGSFPLNVAVKGEGPDFFEKAVNLKAVARLQDYVATLPDVDKSVSLADYLKLVNYATNRFDPAYYRLPDEDYEVRMLLRSMRQLLGDGIFLRFVNKELSAANIMLLTHIESSRRFLHTRDLILQHVRQGFPADIAWDVTGLGIVISESGHLVTTGQVESLSITGILIFLIMLVLFLSVKVGFVAMVPNIFPILVNFGIMGWLGIELSLVTSLIASIAIGLAVDDTIHYLVRYNREFRKDLDERRALRDTLTHMGRPMIFTTLTIALGFSILMFSSFQPTAIFGFLMVVTLVTALMGDLVLTPSLMLHVQIVTLWDLIRIKLGVQAQLMPLFRELSRNQIHFILLAGVLKKFPAGEVLFRKGDYSDTMYAVISGTLDVLDPLMGDEAGDGGAMYRRIRQLTAGDVAGEMGLVRSASRSATVVVAQPSELLAINWKMLKRLNLIYPPAAQQFFVNLLSVISDKLERTTKALSASSRLDDLTGLHNREGFTEILEKEVQRAHRYYHGDLSLGLIAIDTGSARTNGGREVRDRILRSATRRVTRLKREVDVLGRLDVRTIGVLLPHTSGPGAQIICSRMRQEAERETLRMPRSDVRVKLGFAHLIAEPRETAEQFLARCFRTLEQDPTE